MKIDYVLFENHGVVVWEEAIWPSNWIQLLAQNKTIWWLSSTLWNTSGEKSSPPICVNNSTVKWLFFWPRTPFLIFSWNCLHIIQSIVQCHALWNEREHVLTAFYETYFQMNINLLFLSYLFPRVNMLYFINLSSQSYKNQFQTIFNNGTQKLDTVFEMRAGQLYFHSSRWKLHLFLYNHIPFIAHIQFASIYHSKILVFQFQVFLILYFCMWLLLQIFTSC